MKLQSFFTLACASALVAGTMFLGCKSTASSVETTLNQIDMSAWNYNEADNVYYQTGLQYVSNPADIKYETLGIYVPGAYFDATKNSNGTYTVSINKKNKVDSFSASTAPFVMPIQTPGYAALEAPTGYVKGIKQYTDAGFIFVYAGARGRDQGAPAGVTDFKAAIRYVRYNASLLPGNTDRYFTYGMSGGGAQSALLGATGDAAEYEPYLQEIGAVLGVSDAVMGSMDWCPITNLNVANEAYEWELGTARTGLDSDTQALSDALAEQFALYINDLQLKDEKGNVLSLVQSQDGLYHAGSYYDYLKTVIETSLNNFLSDTTFPYNPDKQKAALGMNMMVPDDWGPRGPQGMAGGNPPSIEEMDGVNRGNTKTGNVNLNATYNSAEEYIAALNANEEWVTYNKDTNTATISSVEAFMRNVKQLQKGVGAFDDLEKAQAENTLFGFNDGKGAHFDSIMAKALRSIGTEKSIAKADEFDADIAKEDSLGSSMEERSNMYNPMYYLSPYYKGYKTSKPAKYWRIHAGIFQGDTAISTEMDYYLALKNYGSAVKDVEFADVWGLYHTEAERTGSSTENLINWIKTCLK